MHFNQRDLVFFLDGQLWNRKWFYGSCIQLKGRFNILYIFFPLQLSTWKKETIPVFCQNIFFYISYVLWPILHFFITYSTLTFTEVPSSPYPWLRALTEFLNLPRFSKRSCRVLGWFLVTSLKYFVAISGPEGSQSFLS